MNPCIPVKSLALLYFQSWLLEQDTFCITEVSVRADR